MSHARENTAPRASAEARGAGDQTVLGRAYGLENSAKSARPQLATADKLWSFEDLHAVLESARRKFLPDIEPNGTTLNSAERLLRFNEIAARLKNTPLTPVGGGDLEMGALWVPAGPLADYLRHFGRIYCLAAYAVQGPAAFKNTQAAAALHEAGHCVVNQREGVAPTKARIWLAEGEWVGRTYYATRLSSGQTAPADENLRNARATYAGVLAERLFDTDYRLGSSIDEIIVTYALVYSAAAKMRRDPEAVFLEQLKNTAETLHKNEKTVRAIAEVLMQKGTLNQTNWQSF